MEKKSIFIQRAERLIQCEIIPNWRVERLAQSRYLRKLLETNSIDCVFDVGANTGQYRDYLRQEVGFEGGILSFEPHPDCVKGLRARAKQDPKWEIFDYALGAENGALDFNIMKGSQFSSFLQPDTGRLFENSNVVSETISVEVRALKDIYLELARKYGFLRPFLKLDTQGFDLEVAKGAGSILQSFLALQTEVSNVPIYKGISPLPDTLRFFESAGFELGALFPANPDHFPVVVDFDTYFIPRRQ